MHRHKVTDRQWALVARLLSSKVTDCGVTLLDNHLFFNSLLWSLRTGAARADLPERFGKPNAICRRFRRLDQKEVRKTVFEALQAPELDWVMLDSTVPRAYQHSAGQKSDPVTECLGRSWGGISTKIHPCIEALCNAVRLVATAGPAGDCPQALGLLEGLDTRMVIADTSYDSDANRAYCAEKSITVVIPNRSNRLEPVPLDKE